jgi:opacity protein-like surface antigen
MFKLKRVSFIVLSAVGFLAASHASAQMKGYASGGLGFDTIATDDTFVSPGNPDLSTTTGKSNFTGQIDAGVRFDVGNMVYGLGLYINPTTLKADEQSQGAVSVKTEVKNLMGLVGELGRKMGAGTVVYGKLSYNRAKAEVKATTGAGASKNFTGFGLGGGARQTFAGNMYLFVDWHYIAGREASLQDAALYGAGNSQKVKPTLTTGLVGLGWTFP